MRQPKLRSIRLRSSNPQHCPDSPSENSNRGLVLFVMSLPTVLSIGPSWGASETATWELLTFVGRVSVFRSVMFHEENRPKYAALVRSAFLFVFALKSFSVDNSRINPRSGFIWPIRGSASIQINKRERQK